MSNKSTTDTIKFGFIFAWLGVVLLKLTGVIDLPWIWVTAPFWAGAAIAILMLLCIALFALLVIAAVIK